MSKVVKKVGKKSTQNLKKAGKSRRAKRQEKVVGLPQASASHFLIFFSIYQLLAYFLNV
jgi:hypothetical protein